MTQVNVQNLPTPEAAGADSHWYVPIVTSVGPTALWVGLALVLVIVFRKQITSFLSRTTSVEAFGAKIFADTVGRQAGFAHLESAVNQFIHGGDMATPFTYNLKFNAGSIYFFSHDLMLTYTGLLTGANPKIIEFTLRSVLNHVDRLGFSNTPVEAALRKIYDEINESKEAKDGLSEPQRADLAQRVWVISRQVGGMFEKAKVQPEPKATPTPPAA